MPRRHSQVPHARPSARVGTLCSRGARSRGANSAASQTGAGGVSSMVEQRTFNPWVQGSSPWRPTCENYPNSKITRLISRGLARSTVKGLPWCLRRTPYRRRPSPLAIRPAHVVSTRANRQDPATTFHLPDGKPGSVGRLARLCRTCARFKGDAMSSHVAIVAGAGGALGHAITATLAASGLTVVAADRNEDALHDLHRADHAA
jgi:hypothetical protein